MTATQEMRELLQSYRDEWLQAPEAVYTGRMHRALLVMLQLIEARLTALEERA